MRARRRTVVFAGELTPLLRGCEERGKRWHENSTEPRLCGRSLPRSAVFLCLVLPRPQEPISALVSLSPISRLAATSGVSTPALIKSFVLHYRPQPPVLHASPRQPARAPYQRPRAARLGGPRPPLTLRFHPPTLKVRRSTLPPSPCLSSMSNTEFCARPLPAARNIYPTNFALQLPTPSSPPPPAPIPNHPLTTTTNCSRQIVGNPFFYFEKTSQRRISKARRPFIPTLKHLRSVRV